VKTTFQRPVTEDFEEEPQPSNPEQRAARQIALIPIMGRLPLRLIISQKAANRKLRFTICLYLKPL